MILKEKLKEKELENVDFVKYQFSDMEGRLREVVVHTSSVSSDGSTGVDGSSIFGDIVSPTESSMLLVPDTETLLQVPGHENFARVLCDVYENYYGEGSPKNAAFNSCPRSVLRQVEGKLAPIVNEFFGKDSNLDVVAHMSPELEFVMIPACMDPTKLPLNPELANDSYYMPTSIETDKVFSQIINTLDKFGIVKEKYHTEVGTFQFEIGVGHGTALKMADTTLTAKYLIKEIAKQNGLQASFIPKYRAGVNGSGMHVHQNLATADGKNLFHNPRKKDGLSELGRAYAAGLLNHASEITALTNPTPVSYKRLVPGCEAPTFIAWDWENRTALVRGHAKGSKKVRVEYRAPDTTCNPYLAFSGMLSAGLSGIEEKLKLRNPPKRDYYHDNEGVKELPGSLGEALIHFGSSAMLREMMGEEVIDNIHLVSKNNWRKYCENITPSDIKLFWDYS